jgi:glutamate/tyrosine decarboxylase-like PLP-dependent enzyme
VAAETSNPVCTCAAWVFPVQSTFRRQSAFSAVPPTSSFRIHTNNFGSAIGGGGDINLGTRWAWRVQADRLAGQTDHFRFLDASGALLSAALDSALREINDQPAIVLLQAGDVNTGGFDDFEALIPMARKYGAWTHVDGAFGMWAAASPRSKDLVRGVEQAHSWATDGHKWLNVPFDCGYAFVAEPEAHRASMSYQASYLTLGKGARDQMDWNPEFSRRARGFASYAALRELGRSGVRELVEQCCDIAAELVARLGELEGVEVLSNPTINQGVVAFRDPSGAVSDEWNDAVIAEIAKEGTSFFSGTAINGRRAMRISVSNFKTSREDVAKTVAAVGRVLRGMRERAAVLELRAVIS